MYTNLRKKTFFFFTQEHYMQLSGYLHLKAAFIFQWLFTECLWCDKHHTTAPETGMMDEVPASGGRTIQYSNLSSYAIWEDTQ